MFVKGACAQVLLVIEEQMNELVLGKESLLGNVMPSVELKF